VGLFVHDEAAIHPTRRKGKFRENRGERKAYALGSSRKKEFHALSGGKKVGEGCRARRPIFTRGANQGGKKS